MINFINSIKTTLASSVTLATAAGVTSMSNRVFVKIGEQDMTAGVNIGRLPVIYLKQINNDYTFEAEPNHIGSRKADFLMRICVPTFTNREETQYLLLERIKATALSVLTKGLTIGVTDVRVDAPLVTQTATIMDVTISTDSSYDNNYDEET